MACEGLELLDCIVGKNFWLWAWDRVDGFFSCAELVLFEFGYGMTAATAPYSVYELLVVAMWTSELEAPRGLGC